MPRLLHLGLNKNFFQTRAPSLFRVYQIVTSCKKSEKNMGPVRKIFRILNIKMGFKCTFQPGLGLFPNVVAKNLGVRTDSKVQKYVWVTH